MIYVTEREVLALVAQPTTKPQVTDVRVQLGSGHGEPPRERARPPGM